MAAYSRKNACCEHGLLADHGSKNTNTTMLVRMSSRLTHGVRRVGRVSRKGRTIARSLRAACVTPSMLATEMFGVPGGHRGQRLEEVPRHSHRADRGDIQGGR